MRAWTWGPLTETLREERQGLVVRRERRLAGRVDQVRRDHAVRRPHDVLEDERATCGLMPGISAVTITAGPAPAAWPGR